MIKKHLINDNKKEIVRIIHSMFYYFNEYLVNLLGQNVYDHVIN